MNLDSVAGLKQLEDDHTTAAGPSGLESTVCLRRILRRVRRGNTKRDNPVLSLPSEFIE